jgi:flagellar biosynthesis chaperone FliJ
MQTRDEAPRSNWGLWILVLALVFAAGISMAYLSRERRQTRDLSATNQTLTASLTHLQSQLDSLTSQLNERQNPKRAAAPAAVRAGRPAVTRGRPRPVAAARPVEDPRLGEMQRQISDHQSRLADHEKEIAGTREDLDKTREDLQGNLNSTRDELTGSIARTHDELVMLQKRGERNFYEFQIDKSKQFQRVGPLSLSLRKADFKRKSYDLAMMVDDNQLQKKGVNLYEPVWINLADRPQPLELVVNQISKNEIKGYLSEPKYKKADLDANTAPSKPSNSELQP